MSEKKFSGKKMLVYLLVMIIAVSWGLSFLVTSILVERLNPVQIQSGRWGVAGFIFLVMLLSGKVRLKFKGRKWWLLIVVSICQPCLYMIFENNGIKYTSASVGSIMIATIPCMVIILNMIFTGKRTSKRGILSILLAFAGVAVCTTLSPAFSIHGDLKGYFLMMGAVLAGAMYTVVCAKASEDYTSLEITCFQAIFAAVVFNFFNFALGYGGTTYAVLIGDLRLLGGILFLGVICSAVCFFAFNKTLTMMDPALANNMNSSMTTVVGALAGILIGGDPGGWYTIVGLIMTVVGVVLSSREIKE